MTEKLAELFDEPGIVDALQAPRRLNA
jgi:hypothetical protein